MKILIIIGSDSDLSYVKQTKDILEKFSVQSSIRIASAHRTPKFAQEVIIKAEQNGNDLIIAAAGLAAHLPGACAAYSNLPVIGIPIDNGPLQGQDALYSIVMMPPGVPVGTMGIGETGAKNAAIFAVQILALKYPELKTKLIAYKKEMAEKVMAKDANLTGS